MKRTLCLLLVALMTISLAACGKKDKEGNNQGSSNSGNNSTAVMDATHYFEPEYFENLPEVLANSSNQKFAGNSMFFIGNDEDYTKTGIYEYSLESKTLKTYLEIDRTPKADPTEEQGDVSYYGVNDEMIVYLYHTYHTDPSINDVDFSSTTEADLYNFYINEWGYDQAMVEDEINSESYDKYRKEDGTLDYGAILKNMTAYNYPSINHYYLVGVDFNGNELFRNELDFLVGDPEGNENFYTMDLKLDKKGNAYLLYNYFTPETDEYRIQIFDKAGNAGKEYKQDSYIDTMYVMDNGNMSIMCYNDQGGCDFKEFSAETATLSDTPFFSAKYINYGVIPFGDNKMLSRDAIGLRLMTNNQEESELYMKWMDSNIISNSIFDCGRLADGRIALYLNHYTNNKYVAEIVVLNETDKEKLLNKTQIRIATLYITSELEEAVVEFNKKNNDYHIDVLSFEYTGDDYDNYNTYLDNFMLSLATDNSIDIIALNDSTAYNHVVNFAQKGFLTDLKPLIEADAKLSEGDFIKNILEPLNYDEKLVAIPSSVSIITLIGKRADVGDNMGWDPKKAEEVLKTKGDDAVFMLYTTKEDILEKCMSLSYNEFVDVEKGSCDFDNEIFIEALEFSKLFPDEINWDDENYAANEPERVNKGKILCNSVIATDFDVLQRYQTVWGDKATYVGYPSAGNNNGALISYENLYGITKNCENPEIAWSLISSMIKNPKTAKEYEDLYGGYNLSISPTESSLDAYLDLINQYYSESQYTTSWDSYDIEIKPLTEDMKQSFKDVIYGTTSVIGSVPKGVMDIIKEEASSYYSGQKSAEEVAKIVQSRVKIYLSETR